MSNTATVTWDWVKIFISVCVCALGSVTTVQILKQRSVFLTSESNPLLNAIGHSKSITPAQKRRRSLLLLFLASISFGAVAVFTMHFAASLVCCVNSATLVGMLALTLKDNNAGSGNVTVEITYEPGFTILSLVFAVLAAFGSFLFATNTFHHLHSKLMVLDIVLYRTRVLHKYNHPKLFKFCSHLSGGVFGALAICGMHFVGMRALSGAFVLEWNYGIVFAAAIIALVADTVGMILLFECERFWQNDVRVMAVVCAVLTTAVTIMHYVGMLSATWVLVPETSNSSVISGSSYIDNSSLLAIVLILALLACAASLGFIIQQFSRRMEMNLGTQQTEIQRLNATIHQLQSLLELIKFIRPVFRSDALRFTLFHLRELERDSLVMTNHHNSSRLQVSDTTQHLLPRYTSDTSSQQQLLLAAKPSRRGSFVVTSVQDLGTAMNTSNFNNTNEPTKNIANTTALESKGCGTIDTASNNNNTIFSAFIQQQPTRVEVLEKPIETRRKRDGASMSDLSNDTIIPGTPGPRVRTLAHNRSNSMEMRLCLPRLPSCLEPQTKTTGSIVGSFDTVIEAITGLNTMDEDAAQAAVAEEADGTGTYNAIHNNRNKTSKNAIVELSDILHHPVCLELLKDSLCESKSLENIQFWLEVQRFKQLLDTPSHTLSRDVQQTVRLFLATSICNAYIRPHSAFEINISASQRNYVLSKFTPQLHPAQCDRELFAAAEHEVYLLMQNDVYPRFMTTQSYNVCKFLLGKRLQ